MMDWFWLAASFVWDVILPTYGVVCFFSYVDRRIQSLRKSTQ